MVMLSALCAVDGLLLQAHSGYRLTAPRSSAVGVRMWAGEGVGRLAAPRSAGARMWAGESRAKKLFLKDNIPDGVSPLAFGVGAAFLIISNFGVAAVVALDRLAPGSMPPINAFTDIANVAMEQAVLSGEVPKPLATFWAQAFWFDLLTEYSRAGLPSQEFVASWCSTPDHYDWCIAAKDVARSRSGM
jgi:hypothetical protein